MFLLPNIITIVVVVGVYFLLSAVCLTRFFHIFFTFYFVVSLLVVDIAPYTIIITSPPINCINNREKNTTKPFSLSFIFSLSIFYYILKLYFYIYLFLFFIFIFLRVLLLFDCCLDFFYYIIILLYN